MAHPHRTVSGTMAESPLVLVDVVTDQGVTGHGIVFTYTVAALKPTMDLVKNLAPLVVHDVLAPPAIEQKLSRRLRLWGRKVWSGWRSPASKWRCGMRWPDCMAYRC